MLSKNTFEIRKAVLEGQLANKKAQQKLINLDPKSD